MNISKLFFCFIFLILLFFLYQSYSFKLRYELLDQKLNFIREENENLKLNTIILYDLYKYQIKYNDYKLVDEFLLIGKDTTFSSKLSDFSYSSKLIVNLPFNACPPCIDSLLKILQEYIPDYEQNNCVFFISYKIPYKYKKSYYGKEVLSLPVNLKNIPEELLLQPFVFVLDSSMIMKDLHIYNKMLLDYTDVYFQELLNKYDFSSKLMYH